MPVDLTQFATAVPATEEALERPERRSTGVDLTQFQGTAPGQPSGPQSLGQEFSRGLRRGTEQTASLLFGMADLAGSVLGSESLRNWAQEGVRQSQEDAEALAATVAGIGDVRDSGDFFDWAAGVIGEQIPNLATVFAGGGIGGGIARASLKSAIRQEVTNATTRQMARQFMGGSISSQELRRVVAGQMQNPATQRLLRQRMTAGTAAGAGAASFAINAGDIQNELTEAGIDAPGTAIVGGAIAAALDAAPVTVLIGRMFPGVDQQLAKGFISDIAKTMGLQGALEGGTEAAQEVVLLASRAYHDPSFDITSPASRERVLEAAAAGALMGVVTGGTGATASQLQQRGRERRRIRDIIDAGKQRLPGFVRTQAEFVDTRVGAEEAEADSVVPGMREMRKAATGFFTEQVAPAVGGLRQRVADGAKAARDALGVESLGIDLGNVLSEAETRVQQRLAPVLNEALTRMHQEINAVREQARAIPESERAQFLTDALARVRQNIKNFIDQRITPTMQEAENEVVEEVQTRDFDDPDSFSDEFDPTEDRGDPNEPRDPQDFTRMVFGQAVTETRTSRTGSTARIRVRTRGDDVVPFATRQEARKALDEVRRTHPELVDNAVAIEERDGGFVIAARDIGNAEALFEQLRFLDGVTDAAVNARLGEKDSPRRVGIIKPGAKVNPRGRRAVTRMDVPTLALAGVDILERSGIELPENQSKRLLRGLDHMVARLLEQGYEFENGFTALQGKVLHEQGGKRVSVSDARRRAQFVPPDMQGERDPGPVFERGRDPEQRVDQVEDRPDALSPEAAGDRGRGGPRQVRREAKLEWDPAQGRMEETPGRLASVNDSEIEPGQGEQVDRPDFARGVTDTEAAQVQATRRAPSRRQKRPLDNARDWYRGEHRLRVALGSVPEAVNQTVHDLVTELTELAALRNRILVVDAAGIDTLVESGHPESEWLLKTKMDAPAGRIHYMGDDVVIYIDERMLVDKKNGDEDVARMNTMRVLAHEIGHLVEKVHYEQLDDNLKGQLFDAFMEYARANPDRKHSLNFHEWMANQFVAWSLRDREASDAVETFFQRVGRILRRMFNALREVYGLTDTYAEFVRGIRDTAAGRMTANPFTRYFMNEGVVGYGYFREPSTQDMDSDAAARELGIMPFAEEGNFELDFDAPDIIEYPSRLRAKINQILRNYPGARQAGIRTWEMMLWLHDQLTASLNGRLRATGLKAMSDLADILNRTPGAERANPTYFNNVQMHRARFITRFNRVLKGMTDAEKRAALEELQRLDGRPGTPKNHHAQQIRAVFDDFYEYLIEAGLPVEPVRNYFPRVWDLERMEQDRVQLQERLVELGMTEADASMMLDRMFDRSRNSEFQVNMRDTIDLPNQEFLEHRAKILNDEVFMQYRLQDLDRVIERYTDAAVKRAEFNRYFGSDARQGDWNPRAKYNDLLQRAVEEGATQQQLDLMRGAVDAALGRSGREVPAQAREWMAWVATYQNIRLLLFATLASLPDIVGPGIRSQSFRRSFRSIRENFAELVNKESDLNNMARTWGIISDTLNQHILTEHMDNHWYPERARRINDTFFRYTGLERWTNFTRAAALAVGRDAIKRWAAEGDADSLSQLGLTVEDVQTWIEGGERTYGDGDPTIDPLRDPEAERKVAEAMVQFVNESVMRPNPSQRPLWASNPAFMLLFHLKSFMYSFHDTITRQVIQNMKEAETPWQKAYVVAMPALMLMAFTGLGLELRELLQYRIWGRQPRTDRMGSMEYVWELATRSGIFGPSQLAIDWEGADDRGQIGVMAVSGPTVNQINQFLSDPLSQTGPKAIPVVGQIPALRDLVRKTTPL